jgi:hypothetical protein
VPPVGQYSVGTYLMAYFLQNLEGMW